MKFRKNYSLMIWKWWYLINQSRDLHITISYKCRLWSNDLRLRTRIFFQYVHIHHLLQYIIINSIWDRLYSQHKFNSLHFNLMWFSFLNVTFHDLSLPRNNEVHFNSILKMKFHSRSPNCGNPSVNLSFLWQFLPFNDSLRN